MYVYTKLRVKHSQENTSVHMVKCFDTHVKGGDYWYGFWLLSVNTLKKLLSVNIVKDLRILFIPCQASKNNMYISQVKISAESLRC